MKRLFMVSMLALMAVACNACGPEPESEVVELLPWEEADWSCSNQQGEHPCNFTLRDQHGLSVSLYDDYYGQPLILDFSAMWCGPCASAAAEVENVVADHTADNLAYVTVLIDNVDGDPPTITDCEDWADMWGVYTQPVLAGSRDLISADPDKGWPISGWPTFAFIDSQMDVYYIQRGFSAETINAILEAMLNPQGEEE